MCSVISNFCLDLVSAFSSRLDWMRLPTTTDTVLPFFGWAQGFTEHGSRAGFCLCFYIWLIFSRVSQVRLGLTGVGA